MDFLEKQTRTLGFLNSCFILIALIYINIKFFTKFDKTELSIFVLLTLLIFFCLIAQVKLYKVSGYKYELVTLPSLILAIAIIYFN